MNGRAMRRVRELVSGVGASLNQFPTFPGVVKPANAVNSRFWLLPSSFPQFGPFFRVACPKKAHQADYKPGGVVARDFASLSDFSRRRNVCKCGEFAFLAGSANLFAISPIFARCQ